jgi:hypothetical protein
VPLSDRYRHDNSKNKLKTGKGKGDKMGSSGKKIRGNKINPYDNRVGNFNRSVHGGSPNKSVRMDANGVQNGYGDSIEDIAKRMTTIVADCTSKDAKSSKKKLLLCLNHLDVSSEVLFI